MLYPQNLLKNHKVFNFSNFELMNHKLGIITQTKINFYILCLEGFDSWLVVEVVVFVVCSVSVIF